MSDKTLEKLLQEIQTQCLDGELTVVDAVRRIDNLVGGVRAAEYQPGVKAKVYTPAGDYKLQSGGYRSRCEERNVALLVGLYDLARAHGSMQPGGVHAGRSCSTKHHTDGINDIRMK